MIDQYSVTTNSITKCVIISVCTLRTFTCIIEACSVYFEVVYELKYWQYVQLSHFVKSHKYFILNLRTYIVHHIVVQFWNIVLVKYSGTDLFAYSPLTQFWCKYTTIRIVQRIPCYCYMLKQVYNYINIVMVLC